MRAPGSGSAVAAGLLLCACSPAVDEVSAVELSCRFLRQLLPLSVEVSESSGAAASTLHAGVFWTHNDGGGEPLLFGFDHYGRSVARTRVTGGRFEDWEDLAAGPCGPERCLYIADIGDNDARRSAATVYRIREPSLADLHVPLQDSVTFRYPEGPRDAEAIFVLPDERIFVVTKGREGPAAIYAVPAEGSSPAGGTVLLERVRSLSTGALPRADMITGADASPDGVWVAIRTYSALLIYRTEELLAPGAEPSPRMIDLSPIGEPQGEGVAFSRDGTLILTSEAAGRGGPGWLSIVQCSFGDDSSPS